MNTMSAVREIMKLQKVKPSMLCDRLEIKSNVLSERFKQENISITKLNEMLKAMDYKIILVPRNTRLPENSFEVGSE